MSLSEDLLTHFCYALRQFRKNPGLHSYGNAHAGPRHWSDDGDFSLVYAGAAALTHMLYKVQPLDP